MRYAITPRIAERIIGRTTVIAAIVSKPRPWRTARMIRTSRAMSPAMFAQLLT